MFEVTILILMMLSGRHMTRTLACIFIAMGTTLCCDHWQFISDYAAFYSLSHIAIVSNMQQISEPVGDMSVAYISYESTGAKNAMEYIRTIQDEIELLVFIGTDNAELLKLLDNNTDIFHSKIMSVMEVHQTTRLNFRLDTSIAFCKDERTSLSEYMPTSCCMPKICIPRGYRKGFYTLNLDIKHEAGTICLFCIKEIFSRG